MFGVGQNASKTHRSLLFHTADILSNLNFQRIVEFLQQTFGDLPDRWPLGRESRSLVDDFDSLLSRLALRIEDLASVCKLIFFELKGSHKKHHPG